MFGKVVIINKPLFFVKTLFETYIISDKTIIMDNAYFFLFKTNPLVHGYIYLTLISMYNKYRGLLTLTSLIIENISVSYGYEIVLKNLYLEINKPGLIQILGPNGAGKTTLLKTITGFIKPLNGRVFINNIDVTGKPELAGKFIGYVPQLTSSFNTYYPITLYELVTCCYIITNKWPRVIINNSFREKIEKTLVDLGLNRDKWFKKISELSGGEIQRGFLARAIVRNPNILLLDEPFSNIDPHGRVEFAEKIANLRENKLVVVTTHDPSLLLPYTDYVLLINRYIYFYGKPSSVLKKDFLEKIYGRGFIEHTEHVHIVDSHI